MNDRDDKVYIGLMVHFHDYDGDVQPAVVLGVNADGTLNLRALGGYTSTIIVRDVPGPSVIAGKRCWVRIAVPPL